MLEYLKLNWSQDDVSMPGYFPRADHSIYYRLVMFMTCCLSRNPFHIVDCATYIHYTDHQSFICYADCSRTVLQVFYGHVCTFFQMSLCLERNLWIWWEADFFSLTFCYYWSSGVGSYSALSVNLRCCKNTLCSEGK